MTAHIRHNIYISHHNPFSPFSVSQVLPGFENLLFGHSSWYMYAATMRIYKHWDFRLSDTHTATGKMSFSSYPGTQTHTHCRKKNNFMHKTAFTLSPKRSWHDSYELQLAKMRLWMQQCFLSTWLDFWTAEFVNLRCSKAQPSCKSPELRWTDCP